MMKKIKFQLLVQQIEILLIYSDQLKIVLRIFFLNYNFAVDNDFNTIEHNSIETELSVNNFVTKFNFIEKNGEMGDTNTLANTTSYKFNENNILSFKTRRNRKISLTEYYDLVYEYKNDCLTAGIKYKKPGLKIES